VLSVKALHNGLLWATLPGDPHGLGGMASIETVLFVTRSGLVVHVPRAGEQCWDAPLPCTPYPHESLALRLPGDIGAGFEVEPFDENLLIGWWSAERPWWKMKPGME
jgi:hypothetical protein